MTKRMTCPASLKQFKINTELFLLKQDEIVKKNLRPKMNLELRRFYLNTSESVN